MACSHLSHNETAIVVLQAMSLMLPKNVSRRLPDDNTLESRMDCLKVTSSYRSASLSQICKDEALMVICKIRYEPLGAVRSGLKWAHRDVSHALPGHLTCRLHVYL